MKWRLALTGWALMLICGWLLVPREASSEDKGLEQILVYPLETGQSVSYRLYQDSDPDLRVLVWLEAPAPEVLNEEESWLYGLSLGLDGPEEQRTQEHWTRSRLTLLESGDVAAETERPGVVVTDSRIVDIEPLLLTRGGTLTIQPLGLEPGQRLLVRVLRQRPVDQLLRRLPVPLMEKLERTYPLPWPSLRDRERRWHEIRWHQALGAEETEVTGIPLTLHGEPSLAPTSVDEGYRLGPGEATAVNLTGPATLWVEQRWEETGNPARLLPEVVATEEVPGGSLGAGKVVVPEGTTWSVRWHNPWENDAVLLSFVVDPPQGRSWGEPPGASGAQPQEPERRRISVYRAGPGRTPIEVPVDGGRGWGALRVEARPLAPADWLLDPTKPVEAGATVSYVVLDEQGREMAKGSWEAPYVHAPFERYVEMSEERAALFAPRDADHPLRAEDDPISERDIRYLYHRYGARSIRFEADALVDLRFLAPLEVEPQIAPEYGLPPAFLAHYHPWELAPYVTLAPLNHEELVEAEQFFRFDATVRIELREEPDYGDSLRTWLVRPLEHLYAHPAFEKVRRRSAWRPWYRTLLGPDGTLEVPAGGLEVDHRGGLGELRALCAGQETDWEASAELIASAGRVLLDLPEGEQTCTFEAPPETRLLAAAKGEGAWYAWRELYRADGRTLTLRVPKDEPRERLFIRAYTFDDAPLAPMQVLVDGGEPEPTMNAHAFRTPARDWRTPEEIKGGAWLVNGGDLVAWKGMQVTLGEDMDEGLHTVSITVPPGRPVLLRFDGTWVDPRAAQQKHWVEAEL